jgi:23S rRNA (pseudouridine1915-N3)-methyltransferase
VDITVAAVGRARHKPEAELIAHYRKITRWNITIKEIPDAPGNLASAARKAREAQAIEKLLTSQSKLFVMDATGTSLTSRAFAALLQKAQTQGTKHAVFAIGGQDGLDAELMKKAHQVIAFGAATWPHQLLRAMLMEQLYRAYTISIGHPYHTGH